MNRERSPNDDSTPDAPWWDRSRRRGFRFFLTDAIVILLMTGAAIALYPTVGTEAYLGVFVAGHFFLFCNLFRIGTRRELVWTALLMLNAAAHFAIGTLDLVSMVLWQIPATAGVIGWALGSRDYHGILWSRVNRLRRSE